MIESWIYILKCQNDKWYIGRTDNLESRLRQHYDGEGSAWTKLYKPIQLVEKFQGDNFDEDKYTLKYMSKYGIQNVRGASYVQIELDKNDIDSIEKRLRGISDKCFNCGGNHFIKDCNKKENKEEIKGESNQILTLSNCQYIIKGKVPKKCDKICNGGGEIDGLNYCLVHFKVLSEQIKDLSPLGEQIKDSLPLGEIEESKENESKNIREEINTTGIILVCSPENYYTIKLENREKIYKFKTDLKLSVNNKIQIKGTINNDEIISTKIYILNPNKNIEVFHVKILNKINESIYIVQGMKSETIFIFENLGDFHLFDYKLNLYCIKDKKSTYPTIKVNSIIQSVGYITGIENNNLIINIDSIVSINDLTINVGHILSKESNWYIMNKHKDNFYTIKTTNKNIETFAYIQTNKNYNIGEILVGDYGCFDHLYGLYKYKEYIPQIPQQREEYYRYNRYGCCYNCGRDSHYANECYASHDIHGRKL